LGGFFGVYGLGFFDHYGGLGCGFGAFGYEVGDFFGVSGFGVVGD
jgi:hypothetical protein